MLSKTILSIFALAFVASATPVEIEARTESGCGNGQSQYCCNSFATDLLFGILPVNVGLGCTLISLLPIGQGCNQQVACCSASPVQGGLINLNAPICPNVAV